MENYEYGANRLGNVRNLSSSPVSPKSMSSVHMHLEAYEIGDHLSCSNYSPASTCTEENISPLTLDRELGDGYVFYSPMEDRWADDDMSSEALDELDRLIAEEIFFLATADFFANLDVESLLQPTEHVLKDRDGLKGRPKAFDLSPHHEDECCYCYACTAASLAREIGYGAHDFNPFCSCVDCGWLEMKRVIKQIEANFQKERNAALSRRGNLLKKNPAGGSNAAVKTKANGLLFAWIRKTLRDEQGMNIR